MLIRTLLFVPMGSLGDKIGFNRMVNYGLLGLAFIFACMMFARDFLQFALVLSVMAVAGTMLYPTLLAKASKIGEKQGIGRILSIYNFFTMVGWGIMPSIGGVIADLFDPTAPFLFSMLITLAAVIMNKSNLIKEKIRKIKGVDYRRLSMMLNEFIYLPLQKINNSFIYPYKKLTFFGHWLGKQYDI
jgi:MFS family permease